MSSSHGRIGPTLPRQLREEFNLGPHKGVRSKSLSLAAQRKQNRLNERLRKRPKISAHVPHPRQEIDSSSIESIQDDSTLETPIGMENPDYNEAVNKQSGNHSEFQDSSATENQYVDKPVEPRALSSMELQSIAEEDAQIAALERKLGRKRKKSKAFEIESLLEEIGGLDQDSEAEDVERKPRFSGEKNDYDDWLRSKRNIENSVKPPAAVLQAHESSAETRNLTETSKKEDQSKLSQGSSLSLKPTKYMPPSLRDRSGTGYDGSENSQIRRLVQRALNKLSESNILDIVHSVDQVFRQHPRREASDTTINLLMQGLRDRTVLNDSFMILHAGFTAALYKVIGVDFGAKLIQTLVELVDPNQDSHLVGKERSNLISFLVELYNFQVITSDLVFDFVKIMISDLSEDATEILLRILKGSGHQLRHDDPSSLSDAVDLLQDSIKRRISSELSVRTKFMVETIMELKENRARGGVKAGSLRAEQTLKMRKTLASLHDSKNFSAKFIEPLHVSLEDIRQSDTRGKWWLIGANYRDKDVTRDDHANIGFSTHMPPRSKKAQIRSGSESTVDELGILARSLGMNTDIRRAIFVSSMSAANVEDAFIRLSKLSLSKKQSPEVGIVLSRCAASEKSYNPFYAALAERVSAQREVRKSMWNPLIELLNCLDDYEDSDDGDTHLWWSTPHARFNLATFYADLIAKNVIGLSILRNRNILDLHGPSEAFIELLLVKVILKVGRKEKDGQSVFSAAADNDHHFASSLRIFIDLKVAKSDLCSAKERGTLRRRSQKVIAMLQDFDSI